MDDKHNAARVARATVKLSQIGQRPVSLDQLGLTVADSARLLHLTWQERVDLRGGSRMDAANAAGHPGTRAVLDVTPGRR
jgi:hypothetical protein